MNYSQEVFEEIELYRKDELSVELKKAFEERLSNDQDLMEALKEYDAQNNVLQLLGAQDLNDQYSNIERSIRFKKIVWWTIGLLTLGLSLYFLSGDQTELSKYSNQELYAIHYEKFRSPSIKRNDNKDPEFLKGSAAFENGSFEIASGVFHNLCKGGGEIEYCFYEGLSFLSLDPSRIESAELAFAKIPEKSSFRSIADWYLALSYLNTNKNREAQSLLKKLELKKRYKEKESSFILKHIHPE